MTKTRITFAAGLALLTAAVAAPIPYAQQQSATPPSPERAQDQRPEPGSPFSVLPGFKVERVTLPAMTESYIVITFDAQGRPVVGQSASGSGSHPRLLVDANNDGVYETEKVISYQLNTCHGLFFEGRTLYANCFGPRVESIDGPAPITPPAPAPAAAAGPAGRGAQPGPAGAARGRQGGGGTPNPFVSGFFKLEDRDGDDYYETIERFNRYVSAGMGDHGPHAIRRGPDGAIWVMIGNNTFIPDAHIDEARTPNMHNLKERQFLPAYRDPSFNNSTRRGIHGPVLRLNQGPRSYSIQFSGLRNAYDFAFTLPGEGFSFDSDMEWDVNLPWYREVRTVHLVPGGDNGYRDGSGKFQDEYFDTLPAVRHLRRGSPVGVETYQAYSYPRQFFDALFEADWSRGRLLYTALTPAGGSFTGRDDLAEFIHGEPMPITDLEVGPDGNIYFTTGGGAGTGGLYKVTWTGAAQTAPDMTGILAVVRQPQPLSSWGWAAIERVKETMGAAAFGAELEKVARNTSLPAIDRMRAIQEMQRHGATPSPALLKAAMGDPDHTVRAAAVYSAGVQVGNVGTGQTIDPNRGAQPVVAELYGVAASGLKDPHALVRRRAAEALITQGLTPTKPSFVPVADVYPLLADPDRWVRYSGRLALEHTPRTEWVPRVMQETNPIGATEGLLAVLNTNPSPTELTTVYERIVMLMRRADLNAEQKIRALRAFEVAVTETPGGAPAAVSRQISAALIGKFPDADPLVNRHLAKVLAYTADASGAPGETISKLINAIPKGEENQQDQIEYVYALRTIKNGWSAQHNQQMIDWFAKAQKWRGGARFTGYMNLLFDSTVEHMSDADKQRAYAAVPNFAPVAPPPAAVATATDPAPGGRQGGGARQGGAGGGGGGGGRGNPLSSQERYDNLIFPRGSGPGVLTGRGGGPNAAAGAQVFAQFCASCHRFGNAGSNFGPDLTKAGQTMLRRDILRAIFFPNEKVDEQYQTTVIQTRDNRTLRGLVVSENDQAVMLKTADAAEPMSVQKAQIASRTKEPTSIMPADIIDKVGGDANLQNVAAYLLAGPQ